MTSYCEVVKQLLNMYATEEIIVQPDVDIIEYKQQQDLNKVDYLHAELWTKDLRWGPVHDEY